MDGLIVSKKVLSSRNVIGKFTAIKPSCYMPGKSP